jgi:hypothetical protein
MGSVVLFSCFCVLAAGVSAPAVETHTIQEVRITDAPRVMNRRMVYVMDIKFDRRPEEFWAFYDRKQGVVVVDFYDIKLRGPIVTPPTNPVFQSFSVEKLRSKMTLSGLRAQIHVGADPGWHVETEPMNKFVIRLKLWRKLKRPQRERGPRWAWVIPLSLAAAAGIAAFFVVDNLTD